MRAVTAQDIGGHYDVLIIGSGAGGGAVLDRLAPSGKRILMLERGGYLRRERENWDAQAVFVDARYQSNEDWFDSKGNVFHPGLHYFVGGNTKVYGAALFRLRREDFSPRAHQNGATPGWPLGYDDFEPYYGQAETLFHVHGQRGVDPTEPAASTPFPHPPVSHEPRIQKLFDDLVREGYHPFPLPLGVLLDEEGGQPAPHSACVRCDAFDGFPCLTNGKADAQVVAVDPNLPRPNVTLAIGAYVEALTTDPAGRTVTGARVRQGGPAGNPVATVSADVVVVACGALSSALLLLRSANDAHPDGLANGSGQVGRNYMRHINSAFMAVSRTPNETKFQKTLGLNDFYLGAPDWEFPLGHIQMLGKSHGDQVRADGLPAWLQAFMPNAPFDFIARHSIDFWLTSEDLPKPDNRIQLGRDGRVVLDVDDGNLEQHRRLKHKLVEMLNKVDVYPHLVDRSLYFGQNIPIGGTAHQAGTARFGTDPATSVLDLSCKAHELDNLYLADASFFPSIGAVNPTLTIIANALRVADGIRARLE